MFDLMQQQRHDYSLDMTRDPSWRFHYHDTVSDTHSRRPPGLLSTGMGGHETGQTAPGTKGVHFNEHPQMFRDNTQERFHRRHVLG